MLSSKWKVCSQATVRMKYMCTKGQLETSEEGKYERTKQRRKTQELPQIGSIWANGVCVCVVVVVVRGCLCVFICKPL